ncbi:caspase domain-containing protein [Streptomyces inhibens]|uniref:caspase family protein n=1 Tax=Streptomyces inhibens TaxID=2293571 RepID=UPI0036BB961F
MGRHRALLIGASDYEMRGVQPLPFIPGDLRRLGSVLESRGFQDVQVLSARADGKQISANYVNARVIGFLRHARRGDTLLILLSGHGVHARGRDFLVPEDIDEDMHPFESGCVAIDWRRHLDETLAEHVVILIDACREGIHQDSMGVAGVREWGKQEIGAALRRKVAYLYACSPAQLALFVRAHEAVPPGADHGTRPGESFSLFSRSVSDVMARLPGTEAPALDEFMEAVQDRVSELHRAYRKRGQPQILRLVTDIPSDNFFFLPRTGQPAPPVTHPAPPPKPTRSRAKTPTTSRRAPSPATTPDRRRPSWIRRGIVTATVLAVVTGALVGGRQWIRSQYYVGVVGSHVAVYQGVSQKLGWMQLSDVQEDHPEIELKYLPAYQRNQVKETIAVDSVSQVRNHVRELAAQASACKKDAARRKFKAGIGTTPPSLTTEEQQLVPLCEAS